MGAVRMSDIVMTGSINSKRLRPPASTQCYRMSNGIFHRRALGYVFDPFMKGDQCRGD